MTSKTTTNPSTRSSTARATVLGELRGTGWEALAGRSVKDELRTNLLAKLRSGEELFPGVLGYKDTVLPAVINAVLSRHHFILLGLRGQAKTRILRHLVDLLDPEIPYIKGTELHDDPFAPISVEGRELLAECGEATPIGWLARSARYVEKLATPDATVADIIGDIDPIKAARLGTRLGDERSVHYGLLPRANRGIFAMNELPDLSGKVQVALFNVMQEGDVQIKGYPVRLPLDVAIVFSANPEDYTARGKIITPLKDRIGSEVRTHYPRTVQEGMAITAQEAWSERDERQVLPEYVVETVEEVAFQARDDARVDKHSGVSQRLPISLLENVVSNSERRALAVGEGRPIVRITDLYAALPAVTGKLELEYEGELKGAESVARDVVRRAIGQVFGRRSGALDTEEVIGYFEADNHLRLPDDVATSDLVQVLSRVPGLLDAARALTGGGANDELAAAAEFVLEGLHARKLIARSEERGFVSVGVEEEAAPRRRWN
ncbi:MAG TPA: sigma 54-interacting transcriptional regulator [Trueperaceae bacterium]|nr:sigma 54-interacting transcriptional regulator [Trueperaceae bacterium]